MIESSDTKRNEPLKVVVALSFLALVIVFFIVPLLTDKKGTGSRNTRRSPSHATRVDSEGPMMRGTGRHVPRDSEDGEAATTDLLRRYGSWTGNTLAKEIFSVTAAVKVDKGR